jgi:ubiquinone/menaquinone biosynthesis C-methylase UbiE
MTSVLDLTAVKARQQKTWASGHYHAVAAQIHSMAEALVTAADLRAGSRVLDVAAGSGNAAIAAARGGAAVTAIDYVPELLARGRVRATAEGLSVDFVEGDAEQLPFPDATFDAVLSVVGVMFAPDQPKAAAELLRVCRPAGTIALVSWTPDGFVGDLFRTMGRRVPPPQGLRPPMEWGTSERLAELFGDNVEVVQATRRDFVFHYRTPEEFADFFRTNYGPTLKAFEALDDEGRDALYADLVDLARSKNTATDGTVRLPSTYLEFVARRRS